MTMLEEGLQPGAGFIDSGIGPVVAPAGEVLREGKAGEVGGTVAKLSECRSFVLR